jgi:threonine dehydrogenase-like Zn-dependent dehydrogenase
VRAVVYESPGQVAVADVDEPRLQAQTDAIVQVTAAGICGTDLHASSGHMDGVEPGTVLGHEFTGTIVECGRSVLTLSPGDRVMSSDFTACGHCWWCRRGEHWHCRKRQFFGTGRAYGPELAGAQAQYVRVPYADVTLARLPGELDADAALLIGDNLATGWIAAQRAPIRPGDVVAVVGGGPVGQLASLAAQTHGAAVVVVSDPVAGRRETAAAHGAVASEPGEARALLDAVTDGRGADVVVEAVGSSRGLDAALELVRDAGVVISVSAHQQEEWNFPLARSFAGQRTVRFVIGDSIGLRDTLTALAVAGLLTAEFLVTSRDCLDGAPQRYRDMRDLTELKVILDVQENR